ncbi:MAG: hypothetical protein EOO60_04370 [Hymenobacter sp.]|nr:MAG: hypothetical protein EOO60_04370 [Hymenobacter sp.]
MAARIPKINKIRASIPAKEEDLGQTKNLVENPNVTSPISPIVTIMKKGLRMDVTWSSSLARTANGAKIKLNDQNERAMRESIKFGLSS